MLIRRTLFKGLGPTALLGAGPARPQTQHRALGVVDDLALLSATDLIDLIRRRKISCQELLRLYLARIERFNPNLNALV